MDHNVIQNGNALTIQLSGRFTFADNKIFSTVLGDISAGKYKSADIDLELLEFIDSAALGILLLIRDKCEKSNTSLVLKNPAGQVKHMFDVSRFDDLFKIEQKK